MIALALLPVIFMPARDIETLSPITTQIISKEFVENLPNPRNLNEMLPATSTYQINSQLVGEKTSVNLRGLRPIMRGGMPEFNVTVDGLPTSAPDFQLSDEMIERIEVLRGPQGTLYGNPRLDGVVNVATKRAQAELSNWSTPYNLGGPILKDNGWTQFNLKKDEWKVGVKFDYIRESRFSSTGDTTKTNLGSWTVPLGTYQRPVRAPTIEELFVPDSKLFEGNNPIASEIGGIYFTQEYENKLEVSGLTIPWRNFNPLKPIATNADTYFNDVSTQYGAQLTSKLLLNSGLAFVDVKRMMNGAAARSNNMNWLNFPGTPAELGNPQCGSKLELPVGTIWQPDSSDHQAVGTIERFQYNFIPAFAYVGVFEQQPPARMRIHCLNMEAKEPADSVKYFPYFCADPVLRAIMQRNSEASLRGPWLQARTWIYTDKASLKQINDRLIPGISPGRYVDELFEVAKVGGLSKKDIENATIFDPALLGGTGSDKLSLFWFVNVLDTKHAKATAAWLNKNPQEILSKAQGGTALDQLHLKSVLSLLFRATSPEIRMATLQMLAKGDPNLLKDKVPLPRVSLDSEDPKEVEAALTCVEKYYEKLPTFKLEMLSKFGATDSIKSRSAALLSRG